MSVRRDRAKAALVEAGCSHLVAEIGPPEATEDGSCIVRPGRALNRDEAMAMLRAWQAAYSDLPTCAAALDDERCPIAGSDRCLDCQPDYRDERYAALMLRLQTEGRGLPDDPSDWAGVEMLCTDHDGNRARGVVAAVKKGHGGQPVILCMRVDYNTWEDAQ